MTAKDAIGGCPKHSVARLVIEIEALATPDSPLRYTASWESTGPVASNVLARLAVRHAFQAGAEIAVLDAVHTER